MPSSPLSSPIPRLPWELTDTIIDQLQLETRTLGVCALVCTEWSRRSRHHAFSTIQLWPWRVPQFVDLCGSPNSTLPRHVRRLELDDSRIRPNMHNVYFSDILSLVRLPAIQSIQILNVDWTTFSPVEQTQVRQKLVEFHHLSSLEFDKVTFFDLREVANIANSFPLLKTLSANVSFMKFKEHAITSASSIRLPNTLKRLDLGSDDAIPVVLNCISANTHERVPHIESLSIHGIQKDHLPHIRHTIKRVGHHLHHLVLGMDELPCDDDLSEKELLSTLKLSKLSRLRRLSLEGFQLHPKSWILETTLPGLLSRLESPFLHTVDLTLTSAAEDLDQLSWAHLQRVLMELHFFGLQKVNIRICIRPSSSVQHEEAAEATVRKMLHELEVRDALHVEVLHKSEAPGPDLTRSSS